MLTDNTWYLSPETGMPDHDLIELRREVYVRQRKMIRTKPGQWQRFHTFRTAQDAARFCASVNRGQHPTVKSAVGKYEAEHLFNLVYLIYREQK